MAELLLVSNPRRRRKRRKMSALQRKYFGKKRHRRAKRHARAEAPKRRRHRRRHAATAATRRRRRRSSGARRPAMGYTVGSRKIRRRKLNPHRVRRFRRHRNPLSVRGITGQVMPTVKAGLWGASGALGLDVLWGFASGNATLSPYLSNRYVGFAVKALGAVLVGTLGGKLARGKGQQLATGAMTVVTHDLLKSLLQETMPTVFGTGGSVPLGSYLSGAAPIVGTVSTPQTYMPFSGMGSYLSGPATGAVDANYSDDALGCDPWSQQRY